MSKQVRVCLLAYEVGPYSAQGELAEVVAGLSRALIDRGVDLRVLSPCHATVAETTRLRKVDDLAPLEIGGTDYRGSIWIDADSPNHYFLDEKVLYSRRGIYQQPDSTAHYEDEFERLVFFVRGSLAALKQIGWQPHIVHCHDWPAALAPSYLKLRLMGDPFYNSIASVLTVHNVFFQGRFRADKFELTGLPPELFSPMSPFEYFGDLNILKAGVCYADAITTVSPQYAREVQTDEIGGGLHEVFQMRGPDLVGILNGIDVNVWNPRTDPLLVAPFGTEEWGQIEVNKRALQRMAGLEEGDRPLIGVVMQEPDAQGADLFLKSWPELRDRAQWLILGKSGQAETTLQALVREREGQVAFCSWGSASHLHQFHAGCDMLLMPSRVEPCGLHQFYAMRYGSVPLVRSCGGLRDSVAPYGDAEKATGFRFFGYEPADLIRTLDQALEIRGNSPDAWRSLIQNGMEADFSWPRAASQYLDLYRGLTHQS